MYMSGNSVEKYTIQITREEVIMQLRNEYLKEIGLPHFSKLKGRYWMSPDNTARMIREATEDEGIAWRGLDMIEMVLVGEKQNEPQ